MGEFLFDAEMNFLSYESGRIAKVIRGVELSMVWSNDACYKLVDLPYRFRNSIRRRIKIKSLFSNSENQSDSQATFYQNSIEKILHNEKAFKNFRRIFDYREILEHVDYKLGMKYLERIQTLNPEILKDFGPFKENDHQGNPRIFKFPLIGKTSPTTLRYVSVSAEIQKIFKKENFDTITEIGGGYGGQALIFDKTLRFQNYNIFDLPEVQKLIKRYLSFFKVTGISFPDLYTTHFIASDLVISNYAFSELPKDLQVLYLERVLKHAKNGYMQMNSGGSNLTGRSVGKLSIEEIRSAIPQIEILDEIPMTGPDNYLIIWKSRA